MQSSPPLPAIVAIPNMPQTFAGMSERCRVLEDTLETWRECLIRVDHELRQPVTTLGLLNHALQRAPDLETSQNLSLRLAAAIDLLRSLLDSLAQQTHAMRAQSGVVAGCSNATSPLANPDTEPAPLHGRQVWVVEDHPQVQESMRLLLTTYGAQVTLFNAIPPLDSGLPAPDIVLIDQHLAGASTGLEITLELRRQYPDARLALITGNTEAALLIDAHRADVPVLHKPVRPRLLLQALVGINKPLQCPSVS